MKSDPVIIALDFDSACQADKLVSALGDSAAFYKVGMELYAAAGMDEVVAKPISIARLFATMERVLEPADTAPEAVSAA